MYKQELRNNAVQGYSKVDGLAGFLGCGLATARKIGEEAGAKVKYGKTVLYNMEKVKSYMHSMEK